jgi:hypothetical protein
MHINDMALPEGLKTHNCTGIERPGAHGIVLSLQSIW